MASSKHAVVRVSGSDLELARRMEHTASQALEARSRYRSAPGRKARRRLRKQLAKLVTVLESLQRVALATELLEQDATDIGRMLDGLDDVLHSALRTLPRKADVEALRSEVKVRRKALKAYVDASNQPS